MFYMEKTGNSSAQQDTTDRPIGKEGVSWPGKKAPVGNGNSEKSAESSFGLHRCAKILYTKTLRIFRLNSPIAFSPCKRLISIIGSADEGIPELAEEFVTSFHRVTVTSTTLNREEA